VLQCLTNRVGRRFLDDLTAARSDVKKGGNPLPSQDRECPPLCGDSAAWRWPHQGLGALAGASFCLSESVHLVLGVSEPIFATALTGHRGPTPHFNPSWCCPCAYCCLECCLSLGEPPLVSIGSGPSEQLLGCDFSLRHAGGEGGRVKSEKERKGMA